MTKSLKIVKRNSKLTKKNKSRKQIKTIHGGLYDLLQPIIDGIKENKINMFNFFGFGTTTRDLYYGSSGREQDIFSRLLPALEKNTSIDTFFIDDGLNKIVSETQLNNFFKTNNTIKNLSFSGSFITFSTIPNILQSNFITHLNLESMMCSVKEFTIFLEALKTNSTLKSLNMSRDTVAEYFYIKKSKNTSIPSRSYLVANAIKNNPQSNITSLSFNHNELHNDEQGLIEICSLLLSNSKIEYINLENNKLESSDIVQYFNDVLKTNTSLKRLCFANNRIRDYENILLLLKHNIESTMIIDFRFQAAETDFNHRFYPSFYIGKFPTINRIKLEMNPEHFDKAVQKLKLKL